jgi:hypothetical protein
MAEDTNTVRPDSNQIPPRRPVSEVTRADEMEEVASADEMEEVARADEMEIVIWQASGGRTSPGMNTSQFHELFRAQPQGHQFIIEDVQKDPRSRPTKWRITFSVHPPLN